MIRGRFMTSNDDCTDIFAIRREVFGNEQGFSESNIVDENDKMAYYALVFDENDVPMGTGRLTLIDDKFVIGKICVLKQARGQGLGDLVMRMLLVRAEELHAPKVYIRSRTDKIGFYQRYGFTPTGEVTDVEGVPHRWMSANADEIDIEGSCSKNGACEGCEKTCDSCNHT